jgi:hypothetical protein
MWHDLADIIPVETVVKGDTTGRQHLMRPRPQAQASPNASGPSSRASSKPVGRSRMKFENTIIRRGRGGERTLPSMRLAGESLHALIRHEATAPRHYASRFARFRPATRSRRVLCLASWLYRFFGGGGTFLPARHSRDSLIASARASFFAFSHVEIRARLIVPS